MPFTFLMVMFNHSHVHFLAYIYEIWNQFLVGFVYVYMPFTFLMDRNMKLDYISLETYVNRVDKIES